MADATIVVNVAERNPQVAQTLQGVPKLGIKTTAGKWLQVTGDGVGNIQVGQDIVVTDPKPFGKQWFASLKEIKVLAQAAQSSNGNGAKPHYETVPQRLTWDEFERTFRAAHAMVLECEPDGYAPPLLQRYDTEKGTSEIVQNNVPLVMVDRSAARATMINTIVMALTKDGGRIEPAPEIPF